MGEKSVSGLQGAKTQIPHRVLMVRPRSFRRNEETAHTNAFQKPVSPLGDVAAKARDEFELLRAALISHEIGVATFDEPAGADTPDAVFPNNWFASMPDGRVFLFPMLAVNRRREVQTSWLRDVLPSASITDLRSFEEKGIFLEGTGSLIFDHDRRVGYGCYSARTQETAMRDFAKQSGYDIVGFHASDAYGGAYYHTNVIMAVGSKLAVLCAEAITDSYERDHVVQKLKATGRTVVTITRKQVQQFAGNLIELANATGDRFWVCSETAWAAFTPEQRAALEKDAAVIKTSLPTIETLGGGGARCMIAELF